MSFPAGEILFECLERVTRSPPHGFSNQNLLM
jgi:hypothetical protein